MDSPQNEIPRQLMEEMIENNETEIATFFENLQAMTGVKNIRVMRLKNLEEKIESSTQNSNQIKINLPSPSSSTSTYSSSSLNQGYLLNMNSKIKSLEHSLDLSHKKNLELVEEINQLRSVLHQHRQTIEQQNNKIEQLELRQLKESSVPKKNQISFSGILGNEVVARFLLLFSFFILFLFFV